MFRKFVVIYLIIGFSFSTSTFAQSSVKAKSPQIMETETQDGYSLTLAPNENLEEPVVSDSKDPFEEMSTLAKVGIGVGVTAVVLGIAYLAFFVANIPPADHHDF